MKLYGLKTCDTCRKALQALTQAGFTVQFIDLRADDLSDEERARFFEVLGEDLLNTRSTTWRGLSGDTRKAAPLELLKLHPALMKRPVIEDDHGALTLGWGAQTQAQFGL
jgi:arsenate reductase